jgi:hypothetical protein
MRNVLQFIRAARKAGVAYIDVDGTLLKKFEVPDSVPAEERLLWWLANKHRAKRVWSRIALLWVLRLLRVRLIMWTNRSGGLRLVTYSSLGRYTWSLFEGFQFHGGHKRYSYPLGPVLDDEPEYVALGRPGSLLVESK